MSEPATPEIRDNPDRSRYELWLDGEQVGLATYRRSAGQIEFTHTEIDEAYGGRGLASTLINAMLDDVPDDIRVVASCPFVARYVETHPERQPLLDR